MTLRELKAEIDELCERDPQAAIALARRIHNKLQPGFPIPLTTLHQQLVEQSLQGTPPSEEELEKVARKLRDHGSPEEEIQAVLAYMKEPGPRDGMSFGRLHIEDICAYVEALWRQGWGDLTLEIQFENPDDDHLTLTILELGKAWWQENDEDGA
jgi:hypothetical protein